MLLATWDAGTAVILLFTRVAEIHAQTGATDISFTNNLSTQITPTAESIMLDGAIFKSCILFRGNASSLFVAQE